MKRPVARRLRAVSAITCAFACTAALAQIVNPSPGQPGQPTMPGHGMPGTATSLPTPTLLAPAADLQIRTPIASTHSQAFSWSAPRNAPVPERYVLCVALSNNANCNGDSNAERVVVETPSTMTQYLSSLPSAFNDKMIYWTVAACGAGYGGSNVSTVLNPGGRYANCTWAPRRKLDATPRTPAPNLTGPEIGYTTTGDRQEFTWDAIPEATAYRFCLADDLRDCQSPSLSGDRGVISRVPTGTRTQIDLAPLRRPPGTRTMVWTVFPCYAAPCVNTQPMSRSVTIGPPPPRLPPPAALTGDPTQGSTFPRLLPAGNQTSVFFSWLDVTGATSFNFCIARQNGACGSGDSYVSNVSGLTRLAISVPYSTLGRFGGNVVNWTVASCDAERRCGDYKTPAGTLLVARVPQPTRLARPASGGQVYVSPNGALEFFWQPNPMAFSYTLKVNGVEFAVANLNTSCLLRATGSVNNAGQPEGTARWSVKACNGLGCTEGEEWEMRLRTFNNSPSASGPVAGGSCPGTGTGVSVRQ
jgi:hypothetical protein